MTRKKLTNKQAAFVQEYLIDLNATQAAIRAGYSPRTAGRTGHENLKKPEIAERIQQAREKRAKKLEINAENVLKQWWQLSTADPRELVNVRVSPCRRCHGKNHAYQWLNKGEYLTSVEGWKRRIEKARQYDAMHLVDEPAPSDEGGYGYDITATPNPKCPHCRGHGITSVHHNDTSNLSPAAARLYAGARMTQAGIVVDMHDQAKALENVAKHLGMFTEKVDVNFSKAPRDMSDEELEEAAEQLGLI